MFEERYRSHHDAEQRLAALLSGGGGGSSSKGGRGSRPAGPPPVLRSLMRSGAGRNLLRLAGRLGMKPPAGQWKALERILRQPPPATAAAPAAPEPAGIYLHVPYCDKICSFCNLNRRGCQGIDLDAYADALIAEIKAWGRYPYIQGRRFESVYFGGGTPTVLRAAQLAAVLAALRDNFPLADTCEISVESTQHNLPAEKALALQKAGVNRFSIGIQTLSERGRKLLGRTHTEDRAREELRRLREAFDGVLGIDIIYSYPGQTLDELRRDADFCAASNIDSVSFYSLMVQKGSALSAQIETGRLQFERDLAFDLERHNLFYNTLRDAGFTLLEFSKLARPGRDRYRYIQIQYGEGDLVPIGQGAGGNISGYPLYSPVLGQRMTARPQPAYRRYHKMLGMLQFGVFDPARLCADLSPAQPPADGGAACAGADAGAAADGGAAGGAGAGTGAAGADARATAGGTDAGAAGGAGAVAGAAAGAGAGAAGVAAGAVAGAAGADARATAGGTDAGAAGGAGAGAGAAGVAVGGAGAVGGAAGGTGAGATAAGGTSAVAGAAASAGAGAGAAGANAGAVARAATGGASAGAGAGVAAMEAATAAMRGFEAAADAGAGAAADGGAAGGASAGAVAGAAAGAVAGAAADAVAGAGAGAVAAAAAGGASAGAGAGAAAAAAAMRGFEAEGLLLPAPDGKSWTPNADGVFWGNNMAVAVLERMIRGSG